MDARPATAAAAALTEQEAAAIADAAAVLKTADDDYVKAHPELGVILAEFTKAVLVAKPADLLGFARAHFSAAPAAE